MSELEKELEKDFNTVLCEILSVKTEVPLESAVELFSHGIDIPRPAKTKGGETVYTNYPVENHISEKEVRELQDGGLMFPAQEINGMGDISRMLKPIASFLGSKTLDSRNCEKSDNIIGSSGIFMSSYVLNSKKIGFSSFLSKCEYLYGSKNMAESSFCIGCHDSGLLTNCFGVSWSKKCSDSLFCHDCFDLQDCMFCFHLFSKQYCIANRQYSKEAYYKIKKMVVEHLLKNDFRIGIFPKI